MILYTWAAYNIPDIKYDRHYYNRRSLFFYFFILVERHSLAILVFTRGKKKYIVEKLNPTPPSMMGDSSHHSA